MKTEIPYEDVTETSGIPLSDEAASMMATRYGFAADRAAGARVLELGCGSGIGIGLLAQSAKSVVGGDINAPLLAKGRAHYRDRASFVRLSAHHLPFADESFDAVFFMEATYYVPELDRAVAEIARVLSHGGLVGFVNANPDRPDFIRSPHSHDYHSADAFRTLLGAHGFEVTVGAAYPVSAPGAGIVSSAGSMAMRLARQLLEAAGLVPTTLAGRARLKRLLLRGMRPLPPELPEGYAAKAEVVPVGRGPIAQFKVIYVEGRKR